MSEMTDVSTVTTLPRTFPRPWEEETSFHDTLYDWMGRAPWLAVSGAAHLLVYFILASIPWNQLFPEPPVEIQASIEHAPEELIEEPAEEIEDEVEEEPEDEPELQDDVPEVTEDAVDDVETAPGELDSPSLEWPGLDSLHPVLGTGGAPGGGGKLGGRFQGDGRRKAGSATVRVIADALDWLEAHQSADGSWDGDGFDAECGKIGQSLCDGAGHALHDVGLTGIALLAFLGDGHTMSRGRHQVGVRRGIEWLRSQQEETGLIGSATSHDFLYDHALATLALCEALYFSRSPSIKGTAQRAIDYIHRARNPYGAWRYDVPPNGRNDVSVTGWMIFALISARDAKLSVDEAALEAALAFLDEVSDSRTGRVGYTNFGTPSSRTVANKHFPTSKGEAMTAVGLLSRIFLGQDRGDPLLQKHADLLRRTPPLWDPDGFGCDMYYWYYGTYAMFQMGGDHWRAWERGMKRAILPSQRRDGDLAGSWDPVGPWGYVGGRIYATALMTLSLEVYYRYAEVLGAR